MLVYREEKKETLTLLKEKLHVLLGSSTSKVELLSITCNQTQQNFIDDIFCVWFCGMMMWFLQMALSHFWLTVSRLYASSYPDNSRDAEDTLTGLDHRPEQCKYQRMERQQKDLGAGGEQAPLHSSHRGHAPAQPDRRTSLTVMALPVVSGIT